MKSERESILESHDLPTRLGDEPDADAHKERADAPSGAPRQFSRRQVLIGAAGGLAALGLGGLVGYEWPHAAPDSPSLLTRPGTASQFQSFVTRPDLAPPTVRVTQHFNPAYRLAAGTDPAPEYVFVSPRHLDPEPSQAGLMILDREGHLVYFDRIGDAPFDFNCQTYNGRPCLTWWHGEVIDGYGVGQGKMADSAYKTTRTIQAGHGLREDLHELNLTANNTALITAYEQVRTDLSSVGGAKNGTLLVGHAQEIDLASGKVLFDWNSASHIALEESYSAAPPQSGVPYDFFHINSISETPDGNLLISARNTWTLYKVERDTGKVLWRMNGKHSDFTMDKGANFFWQHDSRMVGANRISVFDDGGIPAEERQSRGLLLDVDFASMRVSLGQVFLQPASFLAANQGSVQVLSDGRVFVGWGNQPYYSEFAPDGTLLMTGEFPTGIRSYRAFLHPWVGHPSEPPRVVAQPNSAGGSLIYVSWNGATEVANWRVFAGEHPSSLTPAGLQAWSGFETAIAVSASGPWFSVMALDANSKELGRSKPVRLS